MEYARIRLGCIGNNTTVDFAVNELVKYLKLMDEEVAIDVLHADTADSGSNVLWVGIDKRFFGVLPKVENKEFDDAIAISVKENVGFITGTNPRSVLIAAYRFLRELGCRWVRPGKEGERIPRKHIGNVCMEVCESASYRYRGVCIEGACLYENVFDLVEYLPKVSMNTYFLQGMKPDMFFTRWYGHEYNPYLEEESFTKEDGQGMILGIEAEMKRRGLLNHRGGHGWTWKVFDRARHIYAVKDGQPLPEALNTWVAEIDGQRKVHSIHDDATNLCYSNKKVRNAALDEIVSYCRQNPQADSVHIWLADMPNNHCECPACRKKRPSDWYVLLLNELDERLNAEGIKTKIVFLLYFDLLWAPVMETLKNKERFTLMFAPSTREYGTNYGAFTEFEDEIPEYERNKLVMPRSLAQNLAHLRSWQAHFTGDSFAYEYHLMWPHLGDIGYEKCARNLYDDIKDLKKIGLNGFINPMYQRCFFPSGLPFYIMAETLWNDQCDYAKVADDYYKSAFGEAGERVHTYLNALSELSLLYDQPWVGDSKAPYGPFFKDYGRLEETVLNFREVIRQNLKNDVYARNWELLEIHGSFVLLLGAVAKLREERKDAQAYEAYHQMCDFLYKNEIKLRKSFDMFEISVLERKIFKQK